MKTLYININNEEVQSNEELEVLKHDLDGDFFFYLGEKIAKGSKVENETALITDFNTKDNEEDYKQIIAQWNKIKAILFSEECEGKFEFILPNGHIHWLRYSEMYNCVYDKNFSHGESAVITIDLEDLYEDSIEELQRKILRKLQRDDLYLEIDEIVFNDDAVTRKSPIVRTIKDKYEGVGFKAYKKWMEESKPQENILNIGTPITNGEDDSNNDLTLLVNWICDEFKKEKAIDWRKDEVMMSKVYNITRNALNEYEASWFSSSVDIWIPYVAKCDSNGNPIHTTNFNRTLSKGLLHSLKHPDEVEDESWGWEYVRYLGDGLTLKRHNYKYGLVDNYGIIIAQCEFNEIMQFKSGNIRLQKSGKFGLINKDKTINIPCIYDEIFDLEDGLAKVKIDGKWAKVNESGITLWLRDDDKRWYYTCNNGIIHTQGVTLGSTKISDLDYSKISSVTSKDIDDLSGNGYTPTLSDKVFFIQKKSSDAITLMNVENWASGDYEYDRLINTIHHLGLKPIYNNGNNICIYQTEDLLLKFLVVNNSAIFVEYSESDHNIIESMQEHFGTI